MGEENLIEHSLFATQADFFGIDRYELERGKRIGNWNPESYYRSKSPDKDGTPDDILSEHLCIPTFSPRLQAALKACGVGGCDVQFLPVRVFQSTGAEIKGYAIANIITRLKGLDYERSIMLELDASRIDPLTGEPRVTSIWTPGLRKEVVAGHDLIRLVEFFPSVLVSGRFAGVFREGKFTGATLMPVLVT
jgi:hypothetical protein